MRFIVVLLCLLAPVTFAANAKLNVLFIAVDDLRPELACYGNALIQSPNIDRLAKQGVQFNRAYCQLALCNPSRASLLSGRRPETLKIYDLATFVRTNNPDVVTLPELFKNNGYRALSFGKIFHAGNGNHDDPQSWSEKPWHGPRATATKPAEKDPDTADHSDDDPYASPDCADEDLIDGKIAQAAIKAMRANKDQPMFLAVGFHRPHLPFIAPKKYWDQYDHAKIPLATNGKLPDGTPAFVSNDASELRRYKGIPKQGPPVTDEQARDLVHGYYACVSYVDAQIGKVLAELDALGLRDKTIIVLWGDHGYQLGEHGTWNKRTNWEIATRVPLIISFPDQKTRGKQSDALVELIDLYPTLAEMSGLSAPEKLEGTSLKPLLNDTAAPGKSAVFSVYQKRIPNLGVGLGRAMRTDRYRFIEWSAPGKDDRVYELYDHQDDPSENTNLANRPENKELVHALAEQLHGGWKQAQPNAKP